MRLLFTILPLLSLAPGLFAEPEAFTAEQIEFFEKQVRPVLVENCYDCHEGAKAKVGLQLDHREGWLRGTDYHKIVNLEKPQQSRVLQAVRQAGGAKPMPDKGEKLAQEDIAALAKWIEMGLPWPDGEARKKVANPKLHWSFQPRKKVALPNDFTGHPIDYFVKKAQREKGITKSAPQADRRTLYRRLSYDLVGLPPKFSESQAFVADKQEHKIIWPKLVDRFLQSPHYGERWARHWMDIARYSDTKGYEAGGRERRFVYSYAYRDWLIRAFNDDLPFDQFLLYQLAADQLVKDWKSPERAHLAAMGFISLSKNGREELVLDDRIDTTFRGMMALTVSCARCHDHKFDPVSTKEYYSLYGIFRNSVTGQQPTIEEPPNTPEYKAYLAALAKEQKKVTDFLAPHYEKAKKKFPKLAGNQAALKSKLDRETLKKARELQIKVDKFVANKKMEPAKALVVTDRLKPLSQKVYIRGNPARKGELAPAQFLSIASASKEAPVFKKGSGRLEMAHQIASAGNPLTARVIVNRIWMWHFGEGIVRTVSDFGIQGEHPDNPELLDWLANWFIENGWSVKELHRLILTSSTWQQSCDNADESKWMLIDPENRLLWKNFRRRLDFEQMRDSYLAISGNLDPTLYGRTVTILKPPFSKRRSVYAYIDRQNLPSVFRHFDFSNPQETTGQRQKTTIPFQALFTMNSPFVIAQAEALGRKTGSEKDRVGKVHQAVFSRQPSEQDRILASSFLNSYDTKDDEPRQNLSAWSYGWGGVDSATGKVTFKPFTYWDGKGKNWRVKKEYPIKNSNLNYLSVGRLGNSHPGHGKDHNVIVRWHAPRNMKIDIASKVIRNAVNKGNGLNLYIVSTRQGILYSEALPVTDREKEVNQAAIQVQTGEIICFITDSMDNIAFDGFVWNPAIINSGNASERWKMSMDFAGPQKPLNGWEAYSQALLNTNRFLFID